MVVARNTYTILTILPLKLRFSGAVPAMGTTLVFRFMAPWLNGGAQYDVSYVVGSRSRYSDTTFTGLKANLTELFAADTRLAGKVNVGNSGDLTFYPITPQAGELSVSYLSGPSGTYCTDWKARSLQSRPRAEQDPCAIGRFDEPITMCFR